jgi:chromosome condensin MukBEF ATPase and DNA-binding subunit MukB
VAESAERPVSQATKEARHLAREWHDHHPLAKLVNDLCDLVDEAEAQLSQVEQERDEALKRERTLRRELDEMPERIAEALRRAALHQGEPDG